MRRIIVIIGAVLLLALAYFLIHRKPAPPSSPPQLSQDQLQGALQNMVTKKTEKKSLQIQLAVYEKLLTQFPDDKELQHRAKVLQERLKELE